MLLSQLSLSIQQSLNFSILAMPARLWNQHSWYYSRISMSKPQEKHLYTYSAASCSSTSLLQAQVTDWFCDTS